MTSHATQPAQAESSSAWDDPAPQRPVDLFTQIRAIEASHASIAERAQAMLNVGLQGLGAAAGALTASIGREDLEYITNGGPEGVEAWHHALRHAALEARSNGHSLGQVFGTTRDNPDYVILAAPLDDTSEMPFGGVAMLCPWRGMEDAQAQQLQLRAAMTLASPMLRPKPMSDTMLHADDFARVIAKSGQYKTLHEFAYAVTNSAKQKFGAEVAALSLVDSKKPRLVCISGLDHVKRRSPGVHHIEQAMGECLDMAGIIVEQEQELWGDDTAASGGMLHQHWRASIGGGCVMSIPLMVGGQTQAVLSMARNETDPFKRDEIDALAKLMAPIASALPLIRRSTRSLPSHLKQTSIERGAWVMRPQSRSKKIAVALMLLFALWFMFKPTMYRVTTHASVISEREIAVASPRDATIDEVLVRSGDRVSAGQPLARLDTTDLQIRRSDLRSEVERAEVELKSAIAASDPASAASARALRDMHSASLDHVDHQIMISTIRAPIDGIVVGADLSSLTGRVVPLGEVMMSVADESSLSIELEIPERRVTDIGSNARVRFASNARPEDAGILTLEHVEPSTTPRGERSVFIGYGPLPVDQPWLRPGMEGVAMIDAGRKPNWWLGARHLLDVAHLNFWID